MRDDFLLQYLNLLFYSNSEFEVENTELTSIRISCFVFGLHTVFSTINLSNAGSELLLRIA